MNVVWRGLDTPSLERLQLAHGPEVRAASTVDSALGRFAYRVALAADWTFRVLEVDALDDGRQLRLTSDGRGGWSLNGAPRDDLVDAVDIDLAISPFTNSLPIRRLALAVDDEVDLEMAYVSFPSLDVTVDPQRYTRLDEVTYRYESLDSGFACEITVDADGLVVDYPELFERL